VPCNRNESNAIENFVLSTYSFPKSKLVPAIHIASSQAFGANVELGIINKFTSMVNAIIHVVNVRKLARLFGALFAIVLFAIGLYLKRTNSVTRQYKRVGSVAVTSTLSHRHKGKVV